MPGLPPRNFRSTSSLDADITFGGHFAARTGEARRAHVLNGDDGVFFHQLEAGLEELSSP